MIHAKDVLDRLGALSPIEFGDDVFRATRHGLAPLAPSTRGGRWSPRDVLGGTDSVATLYTSCVRDGALAELAFHYSQLTPFPSKSVMLHRLRLTTRGRLDFRAKSAGTLFLKTWGKLPGISVTC
jgi:hypothetical protein